MKFLRQSHDAILIFFLALIVFTVGLHPEFISFQARFALFAQEMMRSGISFFPHTYLGLYPDYPAGLTVVVYWSSLLFGHVTPFAAILPGAIASALILVFIYKIGALQNRKWGVFAVLFALLTVFFLQEARSLSPDQYISLFTVVSFYVVYSADQLTKRRRLWWLPLLLMLGFTFRGPIGLVIPAGVVCGYYLCQLAWKKLILFGVLALLLLALCCGGFLIAAYYQGGSGFVTQVIMKEVLMRMNVFNNGHGYFFYFLNSFGTYALSFPLALLVVTFCFKDIVKPQSPKQRLLLYLTCWVAIVLVGMSIPESKKTRYVLAMVPAIALIAAYLFVDVAEKGFLFWLRKIVVWFCLLLPLIGCVLAVILQFKSQHFHPPLNAYYLIAIILSLIYFFIGVFIYWRNKKDLTAIIVAALTFITLNVCIVEPIAYDLERTQLFITKFKMLEAKKQLPLVFYCIGPDEEDVKFMVDYALPLKLDFVHSAKSLAHYAKSAYFITKKKDFAKIPLAIAAKFKILFHGKIGHRYCVVFTKK